jgi:GntR family transcriptional regulator, N-acetylglucosamine utilization regulator
MAAPMASNEPSSTVITDGPRPKHVQLTDLLTSLATEQLGAGAMIPSERELMTAYGLSRATVRKSIESLIASGLLERVHGKGTFVARPRLESQLHLASFSQDMRRRGLTPSTRILAVESERPPADVARGLGLRRNALAWRLSRVRLADGQPIALESGWYPRASFPDLDAQDLGGSLYQLFAETYGLVVDSAEQTLWGESADLPTARLLDAPVHTPLLVFRRLSAAAGRPLEYVVSRYRGDRYQIHMSLGGDGAGQEARHHSPRKSRSTIERNHP